MAKVTLVKKSRVDQGYCGRCGDPLPAGTAYQWHKPRFGMKKVRCMKATCAFRQSDLTSSDKLSRAYGAGEMIEDELQTITLAVHINEILDQCRALTSAVEDAMNELEEVALEYEESADNMEEYFEGSEKIDEIRDRATDIEDWRQEFEDARDQLDEQIENLEDYITRLRAYRDEHDIPEDADIMVTTVEGLVEMALGHENFEPFDTSDLEEAIQNLADATTSRSF